MFNFTHKCELNMLNTLLQPEEKKVINGDYIDYIVS